MSYTPHCVIFFTFGETPKELVGLAPAVILAHTSPVMAALQQATRTIR